MKGLLSDHPRRYQLLIFALLLNALAWGLTGALHGGWYPEIVDGGYVVSDHGNISPVSYKVYLYLKFHGIFLLSTTPLIVLLGVILGINCKNKT